MEDIFTSTTSAIVQSHRILYTASPFARSSLLHLQEIGWLEAKKPHISKRANLSSFLFFIVTSGSGILSYDGVDHKLEQNSCVFIDCKNPYSHTTNPDNLWSLKWIHFNGPMMSAVYNKYKERGGRAVFKPVELRETENTKHIEDKEKSSNTERFLSLHAKLYETASGSDYMRDMLINQYLSELLTLLMNESWHPEDQVAAKKKASVLDVKEFLDLHYNERIKLDELADSFFINKFYLTKIFKEQFGMSINSYLQTIRITRAKHLLRFSDKSIEQIGYECGLGAPNYFSQKFKKVEGVSPSVYRKQW